MKKHTSANPMLLELILTIFFFIIAMCIMVQLMVYANQRSHQSSDRSMALVAVTDVIEQQKAAPHEGKIDTKSNGVRVTGSVDGEPKENGTLYIIKVTSEDEDPVSFTTSKYVREGGYE